MTASCALPVTSGNYGGKEKSDFGLRSLVVRFEICRTSRGRRNLELQLLSYITATFTGSPCSERGRVQILLGLAEQLGLQQRVDVTQRIDVGELQRYRGVKSASLPSGQVQE